MSVYVAPVSDFPAIGQPSEDGILVTCNTAEPCKFRKSREARMKKSRKSLKPSLTQPLPWELIAPF